MAATTNDRIATDPISYWEEIFSSRTWGLYPPEELVRFMARRFGAVTDKSRLRVLEIGCGPGPNLWYLAREGYTVAGIDGSATAIQQALGRLGREGLPTGLPLMDLAVGDFVSLPWPDQSFDAVIDIEAIYANSFTTILAVVDEIHRTLKNGGLFFGKMFGDLTTGNDSGDPLEPGTRRNPTRGPCTGNVLAHFFSREELNGLFSSFNGLQVDHVVRSDQSDEVRIHEWLVTAVK